MAAVTMFSTVTFADGSATGIEMISIANGSGKLKDIGRCL